MSTFTSNITTVMSAAYLGSSTGPMVFGEMSTTYFNMEFTQMMYFHGHASGQNPEVTKFLDSLSLMSFQLPFGDSAKEQNHSRRLLLAVASSTDVSTTFLLANKSILVLMGAFLGVYLTVFLMQKYMDSCFEKCPKAKMYAH